MLNIFIPKEPQLIDYGISEEEIPKIDNLDVKPIRMARNREDILEKYSIVLFMIIFYFTILVLLYNKSGWTVKAGNIETSIFLLAAILIIFLWFPFPLVFLGSIPIKLFLDKIIPLSFLYDREDEYSEEDNEMIIKKEILSSYKKAHSQWSEKMNKINRDFPNATKIIPIEQNVQDSIYKWYEMQYASWCIVHVFMPEFKRNVEFADKMEAKRIHEDWWKTLSPYDFEKEAGNWFLNKGYNVNVTQANIDGGVDIIVSKNGVKSFVQCKHYKELVPVNVVRDLKGVMSVGNVLSGFLVCINGCTTGAQGFAKKSGICIVTIKDLIKDWSFNQGMFYKLTC